jgi:hypothetical protein
MVYGKFLSWFQLKVSYNLTGPLILFFPGYLGPRLTIVVIQPRYLG